ncbi:Transcription factor [Penicillium digitatum]|uniref:Uncharacterized protein n=3 Tax=Penicillium digitatum TaxID=36651 RepID=K9GEE1_PEND2|nr:hypothetical protein PDIP_13490 [Penicillium digitatum Pd1]EKV19577.1 hypothetical protein PDIG_02160 [Penicillium digitatum PHI26]EKV20771.1 hypothetical protein PDIP_13490 [Penicillium digitatum Pd1]QQK44858.1 Transcription factor [Penicillium digitatum]
MPAIPFFASFLEHAFVNRAVVSSPNVTEAASSSNLEVVCAWPVSGQYGPGTRVLYYVLIAACVVARKVEWIRNACLAAVLLFPAVAALHGIVLAVLHVDGAVDMDVYGAFQLCAIGILAAPATVRLSQTYFNNPGRNIIFLWTLLLLAGLVSLIVEFMRLSPTICPGDDPASIFWASTGGAKEGLFQYGSNCSMACTPGNGPVSPLRLDAANNVYVIPVPHELSFNTTTLIAAACCIPAILSLMFMWIKVLDDNWEKFAKGKPKQKPDELIQGTNGATINHMTRIANKISKWLALIEIPVFAAAVLAILVKGEMNFWSTPMRYQTEPIQSIGKQQVSLVSCWLLNNAHFTKSLTDRSSGQWAPIVGTALAVLGSLYMLLSEDMEAAGKEDGHQEVNLAGNDLSDECAVLDTGSSVRRDPRTSAERPNPDLEMTPVHYPTTNQNITTQPDLGRRKVARFFNAASALMTTKAHNQIVKTGFKPEAKTTYPETPGERYKNSDLQKQIDKYKRSSKPDTRSRIGSSSGFVDNGEGSSRRPRSPTRHSVPAPAVSRPKSRQIHSNSLPSRGLGFFEESTLKCPPASASAGWQQQLNPFDSTPILRSRAPSISETSPKASSPGLQIPSEIVVSAHERK